MASVSSQSREAWPVARLIPVVKLKSESEQERRAASVLLAVMRAVPSLTNGILKNAGFKVPKGSISTFTEVPLELSDGRKCRPDGVIIVERGSTKWSCLVEIKVGTAALGGEQIECYLDACREFGFDGVLTITNQITRSANEVLVNVDKRKLKSTQLSHLSWWNILTECVIEHRHRGVEDPEQAWLVGELIAYLDHDNSGTCAFAGMGSNWATVRTAARQETLRSSDDGVLDVAVKFEQFIDYLSLMLSQNLGCQVVPMNPRGMSRDDRLNIKVKSLGERGVIETNINVPDTAGPINLCADLRAKRVTVSTTIKAPREGRPLTRINWLLRQLKDAPGDVRVVAHFERTKETSSVLLGQAFEDPKRLLSVADSARNPKAFEIAYGRAMGPNAGRGPKSFVGETQMQVFEFYETVMQGLAPWRPKAPTVAKAAEPDGVGGGAPTVSEERIWYMPAAATAESVVN